MLTLSETTSPKKLFRFEIDDTVVNAKITELGGRVYITESSQKRPSLDIAKHGGDTRLE